MFWIVIFLETEDYEWITMVHEGKTVMEMGYYYFLG
jgi:hypothetical protein